MSDIKKVVLAYSGGLDTSVILKWLIEKYGCEVIAFSADVGQQEDLEEVKQKALKTGASKAYILDLKEEFIKDYCFKALKAQALYEGKYPLGTALNRPIIAKYLVKIAEQEGADAVVHGATGKGNDQVRFEVGVMALNPDLKILAPVRDWEFKSREEEIEYAQKHGIPVEVTKEKPYSIDRNIWSISIECGVLEDPRQEPPEDAYMITKSPQEAPDEPEYITIGFESGIPVSINGKEYDPVSLVETLNEIGGKHGVGRIDIVENRLVGIKSREIYEAPGATILYTAHKELEHMCLDRETFHFKEHLSIKYADLVYNGLWFSPIREGLDAFMDKVNETLTGEVRVKLYKGQVIPVGRKSPYALYEYELATYDAADAFEHKAGEGFCKIWGLPYAVLAKRRKK
ncbi:argininosuccinate synthase [Thermosulfidibacter takaii ABI70S6]|uniref:Argininosuccinate synthase n=1 Tax=Thermosulfidibacter takaii (strain DSM 17441 / JCM 13301 / NBRC 103674 / ABI70S6) TaxID=1298851 RepID=A0A0S3QV29_THET7|nr:argininosuccinate synthase [Thermosulfidibacter takaii]BAT72171.1 argininosuccinate synthase [Thermosulfidibacter takaii ABI70S6]